MKILILLSNPCVGGTETFIAAIEPYLRRQQVYVDVLNTWRDSQFKHIASLVSLHYDELSGANRKIKLKDIRILLATVRREKYDILLTFGIRTSILARLLKPWMQNICLVTGLRGLDQWRKWHHVLFDKITECACGLFVPNSNAVANLRKTRERTPASKLVVIKNGVDTNYFDRRKCPVVTKESLGLPDDSLILSSIGSFREQKGYDFLLEVIAAFAQQLENAHFVWAGTGRLRQQLERAIQSLGLGSRISMLGRIDDVRPLLTCSDIFLMPSREEGMPRALMEAMAMSLPCVATSVGGTTEVIEHGINGFLAAFGDTQEFGGYIRSLARSPDLRRRIGMAARRRITESFDIEHIAAKYVHLFRLLESGERDGRRIQHLLNTAHDPAPKNNAFL